MSAKQSALAWMCRRFATALALLLAVGGCDSTAQIKPPPSAIRWVTVPPPLEPGVTFQGTAPASGNIGSCGAPVLRPLAGVMTIRWSWTGIEPGHGSLMVAAGDTFRFAVPAGADSLRVWAERGGVPGCDTVVAVPRP